MSLNHKRRIFRSDTVSITLMPSVGVILVAACAVVALPLTAWLSFRAPEAPARTAATGQIRAVANQVAVVDGDTLRLGELVVRLQGIVAPARGSLCHDAARRDVDCGGAAANALAALVRGKAVGCTVTGHDDHGRPIGDCSVQRQDLSAALVQGGWARAEAPDLREAEATARSAGRGLWQAGW